MIQSRNAIAMPNNILETGKLMAVTYNTRLITDFKK
jgi:hypothetical protein